MCRTREISDNIVRLGGRTFNQRMQASVPGGINRIRLVRLNNDLESFYDELYSEWDTINENDYVVIGPQLSILIETLKALITVYGKYRGSIRNIKSEIVRLKMNYNSLIELRDDIVNFKIKLPSDPEIKELIQKVATVSKKVVYGAV